MRLWSSALATSCVGIGSARPWRQPPASCWSGLGFAWQPTHVKFPIPSGGGSGWGPKHNEGPEGPSSVRLAGLLAQTARDVAEHVLDLVAKEDENYDNH